MKIYVLIFCTVITGAALYGSTAELPLDQIRQLIAQHKEEQAAQIFNQSIDAKNMNSDQLIALVHAIVDPLTVNHIVTYNAVRFSLAFLVEIITTLQPDSLNSAIIRRLANFSFKIEEIRDLPILYIAAVLRYPNIIQKLLHAGAHDNTIDPLTGNTVLMTVAKLPENRFMPVLKTMLNSGANPLLKNYKGESARDFALSAENFEIAKILQDAEVKAKLDAPDKGDTDQ
jgi:hypothetical protein